MSEEARPQLQKQLELSPAAHQESERLLEEKVRELASANQLLQRYLDAVPTIMVALDTQGCITMINRAGEEFFKQPAKEMLGQAWFERHVPDPGGSVAVPLFRQIVAGEITPKEMPSEYPLVDSSGAQRLMEWRTGILTDATGATLGLLSSGEDITERKLAETAISESRNLLLKVIDTVPARVFWKDPELRYLGCNTVFAQDAGIANRDEMIGKNDYQMVWAEQADSYRADDRAVMAAGVPRLFFEEQQTTATGETVWVRTSKIPLVNDDNQTFGVLGIYEDIIEYRRIEAENRTQLAELSALNAMLIQAQSQLLQSVKMASVGQLAAGVAHEINNPIAFVDANLGALKEHMADLLNVLEAYRQCEPALLGHANFMALIEDAKKAADLEFLQEDIPSLIDESLEGVRRVKAIVENLKDFSRVDTAEWHFANLESCLESTLKIVWNEIKYKADVSKEFAGIPEIECLASQLNQVFLNLLVNAAQAIAERGVITLRTGFDENEVWVDVADTGQGIAAAHLDRIFEPFFTTKPVGKGTGLGLSLAYGIVQRHHGRLEVRSELGKGSVFHLSLPRQRTLDADILSSGA